MDGGRQSTDERSPSQAQRPQRSDLPVESPNDPIDPVSQPEVILPIDGNGDDPRSSPVEAVPFSAQQFPMKRPSVPHQTHGRRRLRSPGLKWYKQYDGPDCFLNGRVLVIDYIKQDQSQQGMRKVAAQEFDSIHGLKHLYSAPDRVGEPLLRVIHCQNADWAVRFLLKKFNINAHDDLVGTDFGKWVKWKRTENRGGKPYLNGKTWKTTHDPWRAISRCSFGLDYLKHYKSLDYHERPMGSSQHKLFELNHYDEEDNPKYGFDVFVQRLSCYIQHKDEIGQAPEYPGIESPYDTSGRRPSMRQYFPDLKSLDNGNVIIIFENSKSERPWDTLISAREQWESRWRRLPFYLGVESHDLSSDDTMALECMNIILSDIWKSVAESWEHFLDVCNTHISILEDKIYDGPADESRAPELWSNSNMWLKVERLVAIHLVLVKEMQTNLRELAGDPEAKWLDTDDLKKTTELVQDDLVKPTANLADLMYKSVEIRDSRHSLQLNTSLWRLSIITFIFLPLQFISTFFGMNVNIFRDDPSVRYYFASAVPLMALVLAGWYLMKHGLAPTTQTPYQRGVYEDMFYNMATKYPQLWSRSGPREAVKPKTMLDRLRWWLIVWWNDPDKTIRKAPGEGATYEDLGTSSRFKRYLTARWTKQLRNFDDFGSNATTLESGKQDHGDGSSIMSDEKLDDEAMELHTTPAADHVQTVTYEGMLEVPPISVRSRLAGRGSGPSSKRSHSSGANSGIMVEEQPASWLRGVDYGNPRVRTE